MCILKEDCSSNELIFLTTDLFVKVLNLPQL